MTALSDAGKAREARRQRAEEQEAETVRGLVGHCVHGVEAIGAPGDYVRGFRVTFNNGTALSLFSYDDAMGGRSWEAELT